MKAAGQCLGLPGLFSALVYYRAALLPISTCYFKLYIKVLVKILVGNYLGDLVKFEML